MSGGLSSRAGIPDAAVADSRDPQPHARCRTMEYARPAASFPLSRSLSAGIIPSWPRGAKRPVKRPIPGRRKLDTTSPRNPKHSSLYDPAVALDFFRSAGKPQAIAKGTTIFSENQKGMPLLLMPNRIYLLLAGEVGVLANGQPIATIGAGEIFGEMASMGRMPRSASAVAMNDWRVIRLDDPQRYGALRMK